MARNNLGRNLGQSAGYLKNGYVALDAVNDPAVKQVFRLMNENIAFLASRCATLEASLKAVERKVPR